LTSKKLNDTIIIYLKGENILIIIKRKDTIIRGKEYLFRAVYYPNGNYSLSVIRVKDWKELRPSKDTELYSILRTWAEENMPYSSDWEAEKIFIKKTLVKTIESFIKELEKCKKLIKEDKKDINICLPTWELSKITDAVNHGIL